ncbi:hypothetical protein JRG19_06500 [Pseudoclavibacter alba]|uniref:hypothetical protein n=1 Tax=Pseudoclavibacter albus TaxID=272241 RepID=UPI0008243374|nr:hypothetical protein [Pseudoclavibacter alba]MBN6778195.1 hypothetical protein [Pseudoclavibacter alba]
MGGNGMKGMDIERGREVSQQIQVRMDMIDDDIQKLNDIKSALQENWAGQDQVEMDGKLDEAIQLYEAVKSALEAKKTELDKDIDEQEQTSAQ